MKYLLVQAFQKAAKISEQAAFLLINFSTWNDVTYEIYTAFKDFSIITIWIL